MMHRQPLLHCGGAAVAFDVWLGGATRTSTDGPAVMAAVALAVALCNTGMGGPAVDGTRVPCSLAVRHEHL